MPTVSSYESERPHLGGAAVVVWPVTEAPLECSHLSSLSIPSYPGDAGLGLRTNGEMDLAARGGSSARGEAVARIALVPPRDQAPPPVHIARGRSCATSGTIRFYSTHNYFQWRFDPTMDCP